MANFCYTHYCVEGPTKEVYDLAYIMNGFFNYNAKSVDYTSQWLGHIRSKLDNPRQEYGMYSCRSHVLTPIDADSVHEVEFMPERKVLKFVTESAWVPENDVLFLMVKEYAPSCKVYYRTEEFWAGPVATNDRNERYFAGDYMVYARFNFNVPKNDLNRISRQCFGRPDYIRTWDDEYMAFVSYWKKDKLLPILKRLSGKNISSPEDFSSVDDDESGVTFWIRKIDREKYDYRRIARYIRKL